MTGEVKPRVTFILLTYNQEKFVQLAVEGALAQEYKNLEVIVSDDCSPDSTYEIVSNVALNYSGCHEVIIRRNKSNLGLVSHFNNAVSLASGEIVIVAAGDDISLPDRVSKTVSIFDRDPNITVVSFSDYLIDSEGVQAPHRRNEGLKKELLMGLNSFSSVSGYKFSGASRGFRKSVFDTFGPLNSSCPSEDTPMLLRCLMSGSGVISPDPAIYYRRHGNSLSNPASLHKMNIDLLFHQYFDDIETAVKKNILSKKSKNLLERSIEDMFARRSILKQFYFSKKKLKYFLFSCLFSKHLSWLEKIKLARLLFRNA